MKANHNYTQDEIDNMNTVSNGSKILKWKQITTSGIQQAIGSDCFQWFKDTKMKANHNGQWRGDLIVFTVSNGSKILKWKQITTYKMFEVDSKLLFPMVQRY